MYNLASLYFLKPDDNAKVLNLVISKHSVVNMRRIDVCDSIMPILAKESYDTALYRPSDFVHCSNTVNSDECESYLPYHIVPNFDSPYLPVGVDIPEATFSICSDNESCRYYLGIAPDAKNTFLVKLICWSNNINEFLRGFVSGLKWYSECTGIDIPTVYLYDYDKPICLVASTSVDVMSKQLPATISIINIQK